METYKPINRYCEKNDWQFVDRMGSYMQRRSRRGSVAPKIGQEHVWDPSTSVSQIPVQDVGFATSGPPSPQYPVYQSPSSSPQPQQQQYAYPPTQQQQKQYAHPPPQQQQYAYPPPQQQQQYAYPPPQQQQQYAYPPPQQRSFAYGNSGGLLHELSDKRSVNHDYKRELEEQIRQDKMRKEHDKWLEKQRDLAEQSRLEREPWDPFGRPGAGAPLRTANGTILSNLRGRVPDGDPEATTFMRNQLQFPAGSGYALPESHGSPVKKPLRGDLFGGPDEEHKRILEQQIEEKRLMKAEAEAREREAERRDEERLEKQRRELESQFEVEQQREAEKAALKEMGVMVKGTPPRTKSASSSRYEPKVVRSHVTTPGIMDAQSHIMLNAQASENIIREVIGMKNTMETQVSQLEHQIINQNKYIKELRKKEREARARADLAIEAAAKAAAVAAREAAPPVMMPTPATADKALELFPKHPSFVETVGSYHWRAPEGTCYDHNHQPSLEPSPSAYLRKQSNATDSGGDLDTRMMNVDLDASLNKLDRMLTQLDTKDSETFANEALSFVASSQRNRVYYAEADGGRELGSDSYLWPTT